MAAEVTSRPLSIVAASNATNATNAANATTEESAADHAVHPAGKYHRAGFRWGYFLLLNAISGVAAVAIFISIEHGEALDPYMIGTYRWLLAHPMVTSAMAFSPLAACMLVGWGYSQRARKRKAAAAAVLARSAELAATRAEPPSA